ncbi:sulfatase-like hydrolase/transferase [Pradoshia sp. D12]|nr:alkaline phosphatase family protein [Bacillus sp. D12]QFK72904.1 sulfatase-like hydrolase/transferase [Pradoshia sp. D12]TPF71896.1 hypothetical protein FHY44_10260 [Bacillus sp. D12]
MLGTRRQIYSPLHVNKRTRFSIWLSIITICFVFLLPLALMIVCETLVRKDLNLYTLGQFFDLKTKAFLLNYLIYFSVINLFYILPRKLYYITSLVISGLFILFTIANQMKLELRNSPIMLSDISLIKELQGLDNLELPMKPIILGLVILIVGILIIYFLPKGKEFWIPKTLLFTGSFVFLLILWNEKPISPMAQANLWYTRWRPELGISENGLIGNFTLFAKKAQIQSPVGYSEAKIKELAEKYQPDTKQQTVEENERPNVIYIMSEAFVDPYTWGKQYFIKDPTPNFRKAFQESMHGFMYSPEYGGGTANVEFEAVTGLSRQFLPGDDVAYNQYLNQPVPSVARAFNKAGYHTTAIHAFKNWYYQRSTAYKNLGFDRFIPGDFMNLDFPFNSGKGYPSDRHMTDSILKIVKENKNPSFIHAVGLEGHMPYPRAKNGSPFLDKSRMKMSTYETFGTYVNKLNSVDKDLGRLLGELKKLERPTIIVFWGDHFPGFTPFQTVYGKEGLNYTLSLNGSFEDFMKLHKVPYFVWNSKDNKPLERDVTPNMFSQIVTEMANIEGNAVTNLLTQVAESGNSYFPYKQFTKEMGDFTSEMKDLQMLQYDMLHGKRYFTKTSLATNFSSDSDYIVGWTENPKVNITKSNGEILIHAEGIPKYAKLFDESDEKLEITWVKSEEGSSTFKVQGKPKKVYFEVQDDRKTTLLKTKKYSVD